MAIPASSTDEKKSQSKALAFFVSKTEPSLLERKFKKRKKIACKAYFSFLKMFGRDKPIPIVIGRGNSPSLAKMHAKTGCNVCFCLFKMFELG